MSIRIDYAKIYLANAYKKNLSINLWIIWFKELLLLSTHLAQGCFFPFSVIYSFLEFLKEEKKYFLLRRTVVRVSV